MKSALQGRRFREFLELQDQSLHAVSKVSFSGVYSSGINVA
jgi:hypothetical protein